MEAVGHGRGTGNALADGALDVPTDPRFRRLRSGGELPGVLRPIPRNLPFYLPAARIRHVVDETFHAPVLSTVGTVSRSGAAVCGLGTSSPLDALANFAIAVFKALTSRRISPMKVSFA